MNEFEDKDFELGKAISKSRLTMPNASFEQQVMARMQHQIQRKNNYKYIRYSLLCFAMFTLVGLAGNYLLPGYVAMLSGVPAKVLKLIFEAGFVFCLLIGADHFIKYFKAKPLQGR
ncbi:hypothetical protein [Mucilaginibacter terrae]|uniref:Cation-transporting P-type ATPase C-terminal domain-containing protein n=1 Tax=Mucilaginibacter terrae TaxID=1955052 RepID=A0ABU3GWU2_9SPHI|nr:hypothetical protein [Mucilaginibacter terrae]MDT3404229.1 hypothetical protein [Mucilaginibacter terrae]